MQSIAPVEHAIATISNNHGTGNHMIPDVMGNHAWGKDDL